MVAAGAASRTGVTNHRILTGQIDLSQTSTPVVIPENELAVYPVPVGIEEGEEKLLVRAAKVAREKCIPGTSLRSRI